MKKILEQSMLYAKRLVIFLIFCTSFGSAAFAQDSKGTEFWICFPGNQSSLSPELYIAGAAAPSTVTITIPGLSFSQTVNVAANGLQVVSLPGAAQVQTQFASANLGIHITATNEVTVYGMNAQTATTDAYLAFPLDAIGTEYYVLAYFRDFSFALPTQATVLATQNNTNVTITSSITDGPFTAGVPQTIILQQGEVYQMRSLITNADFTGTKITADKPVSVFGGAQCTNISGTFRACDHLVEQMPPLTTWGRSFLTVPLATRLQGDVFRFLAQRNGTAVSVNGAIVANLNAGQYFETILGSSSYNRITSNEPILVGQYSRSSQVDNVTSDPFFALVPPDEQFLNSYVVSAGTSNIPNNFLNITSPTSNVGTVRVDGSVVNSGLWVPIQSTGFSGAKVPVSSGVHSVTSSLPVGLLTYGFGSFDSYGYIGGQSFSEVARVTSLTLAPKGASGAINLSRCFTATVRDQFSVPVSGVRVDFAITGPNSSSTGFANTNASGIATFCYTGANAGTDNIVASVGGVNDATSFVWTATNTCSASIRASGPLTFCLGESVTLTASDGASYLWSNGATTKSITVTNAGSFSVKVTNASNCSATSPSVTVATTDCSGTYCTAKGTNCNKGFIKNVFACYGFNNTTGFTGYGDYTSQSVTSAAGKLLGLSITPGYTSCEHPGLYITAYIDWNGDGDFFDAGEFVFAPRYPTSVKTKFYVRVPAGTPSGKKRLRVIVRSDKHSGPCDIFTYGEVEDYTVSITGTLSRVKDATDDAFDNAGDDFSVYPNPVRGERMIIERSGYDEMKARQAPAQMILSDMNGKVIMQSRLNSLVQEINVGKIAAGVYFVTIINKQSKTTQKIVINR